MGNYGGGFMTTTDTANIVYNWASVIDAKVKKRVIHLPNDYVLMDAVHGLYLVNMYICPTSYEYKAQWTPSFKSNAMIIPKGTQLSKVCEMLNPWLLGYRQSQMTFYLLPITMDIDTQQKVLSCRNYPKVDWKELGITPKELRERGKSKT